MTAYAKNAYGAVVYSTSNGSENPFKNHTERAQNFIVNEFKCKDGSSEVWINPDLVNALELLRTDFFRRAMTIRSGYRTPDHNGSYDGGGTAVNSEHMYGTAADIQPSNRNGWDNNSDWVEDAIAIYRDREDYGDLEGVGVYDYTGNDVEHSYIHVDVGPGSSANSLISGEQRDIRPSFWYQWIKSPADGQAYAIYLYDNDIIEDLLDNLIPGGGDPRNYISGLVSKQTRVAVQGRDDITAGSGENEYHESFTENSARTKLLQRYLAFKDGYTSGIDGIYGTGTANAVKHFQERNGLTEDGIIAWNSGNTFPKMFPTLRRGQRDSDSTSLTRNENIKFLQKMLYERLGYTSVGTPDGIFGSNTENAIEDIQGSGADGIVGPNTWDQIAELLD